MLLAFAIDAANRDDSWLLAATLERMVPLRPEPEQGEPHLCLDKGYDYKFVRREVSESGVGGAHPRSEHFLA